MDNLGLEKNKAALEIAQKSDIKDGVQYALKNPLKLSPEMLRLVCNQLEYENKIKEKNEDWLGFLAPPKISTEQASSKITAEFKADLLKGNSVLDLTGGFGMDSFYFSKKIDKVYYNEVDSDLAMIVEANLNSENIEFNNKDAFELLEGWQKPLDLIYLDPDRRNSKNEKLVLIENCQPNLIEIQDLIFQKADKLMVKFSPMLDIQSAIKKINFVSKVYVLAVKNELKELIFFAEKGYVGEPEIHAINLEENSTKELKFSFSEERNSSVQYSNLQDYLYVPDKSISKAGAFKTIAERFQLNKISANTHLYTNTKIAEGFPGKIYTVIDDKPYNAKKLSRELNSKEYSIFTRNFGEPAQKLKEKHGFKESQTDYICFYKDLNQTKRYTILNKLS